MTEAQRTALLTEKIEVPEGFTIEKFDAERDGDAMHQQWQYSPSVAILKNRLSHLPSLCARTTEGEVVGWVMTFRHGQIANLYVRPEYRRRGRGQRVFKYVVTTNEPVYDRSLRSPLWTLWTEKEGKKDDTKKPNVHIFSLFERS